MEAIEAGSIEGGEVGFPGAVAALRCVLLKTCHFQHHNFTEVSISDLAECLKLTSKL